jgi:hypothetical protein
MRDRDAIPAFVTIALLGIAALAVLAEVLVPR